MRLATGAELSEGRYRLQQRLGNGGMASVWLADDERLGRRVAIKVVADAIAEDPHWLTRFESEARAAASLSHPNIVQVFDYDTDEDLPYLVMEYISGGTLAERLTSADTKPVDVDLLARALLSAVGHIHGAGILHRDIKPDNILLDDEDRPRLTDFGIARREGATALTSVGMVIGTLRYLAPEVAAGEPATVRSDLYSTGMVLRAAAGDRATRAAGAIGAMTATRPGDRPASAVEALKLLENATGETARILPRASAAATAVQPAREDTARTTVARAGRTRPVRRRLGAAAAALATIAVVIGLVVSGDDPAPEKSAKPASAPLATPAAGAPLSQQLDALDGVIDRAARK